MPAPPRTRAHPHPRSDLRAHTHAQVSGEKEFFAQVVVDAVSKLDPQTLDLKMIGIKKVGMNTGWIARWHQGGGGPARTGWIRYWHQEGGGGARILGGSRDWHQDNGGPAYTGWTA